MNGRPWTRPEIDDLFHTVTRGGNTLALSVKLQRTHDALIAKAKRLDIAFEPTPFAPASSNVAPVMPAPSARPIAILTPAFAQPA